MLRLNFKRVGFAILLVSLTVCAAFILGTQAGNYANSQKTDKYVERRDEKRAEILKQMGTVQVGDILPNPVFIDLDGDEVHLQDIVDERTIVMYFEPDCQVCEDEIETIVQQVSGEQESRRFVLISAGDPARLMKLRDDYGLRSPILYDEDGFFAKRLKVFTFPFNLVVDKHLVIVDILTGGLTPDEVIRFARGE